MNQLVEEGIYKPNRMYDYQATCFQPMESGNPASTFSNVSTDETLKNAPAGTLLHLQPFAHLAHILHWFLITFLTTYVNGFASIEFDGYLDEEVQLVPCDKQFWIHKFHSKPQHAQPNFDCDSCGSSSRSPPKCEPPRILAAELVPYTNLLLLVINNCIEDRRSSYMKTREVQYELLHECYVENNYLGRKTASNCVDEEFWNVSGFSAKKK